MAGDWIKMRIGLANDPAVISIAAGLDIGEFEVVGMLHHLWSWADTQSQDGHVFGVTRKWIDRFVHHDGFAEKMQLAGWLEIDDSGIKFPNFDRHNGDSSKNRALATERKRKQRVNVTLESQEMSRSERDESVTREEKRREEIKDQQPCDQQAESPAEQGEQKVAKAPQIIIPYDEILKAYAEELPGLPQPRSLDPDRRQAVKAIWTKNEEFGSVDFFRRYFAFIAKSNFLMGGTGWTSCNFDWIFKPKNFRKITESTYHKEAADA